MLRPFRSGYLLSEAVVVSGGEIYLPLIIINYMLVWMERKKKTVNGNWYTNAWITWLLCSGRYILHVSWALCSEQISVRNSYVEEGYFFLFPRSDLLLPVNSCECVAQDFLSICKSKKFFFPFFPPVSFAYTLSLRERMRMREWQVKKPSLQLELIWRSRSSAFSREVDLRKRRG